MAVALSRCNPVGLFYGALWSGDNFAEPTGKLYDVSVGLKILVLAGVRLSTTVTALGR